ncbi:MAG: protoheme IX farnesyltransferase [Dissulfurispiraceae bacterium]
MKDIRKNMSAYIELCKIKIALFATFSSATGFILAMSYFNARLIALSAGVLLLSAGASALNQYQERISDGCMSRTAGRPLPSKRVRTARAACFSLALICTGLAVLLFGCDSLSAALGLLAVGCYNGLYTFLKKISAVAIIPGSLIGTIPPAIGWAAAGGSMTDSRLLALCFFSLLWQIPHFWLFLLRFGKEYEDAGLPSLSGLFTSAQQIRIAFLWLLSTAVSSSFMFLYGLVHLSLLGFSLFSISLWIAWQAVIFLRTDGINRYYLHRSINYYMLFVMVVVSLDRLAALSPYA